MKKVLMITDCAGHGGSIKIFTWLANRLSSDFDLLFCNLSNDKLFYPLDNKVKYIVMNSKNSDSFFERNTIGFLKNIIDLYHLVKKEKVEMIINFGDHALYSIILVKLLLRRKLVISQRVDPYACKDKSGIIRMKLYKYADGLVCQTNGALKYFDNSYFRKLKKVVIANPADNTTKYQWSCSDNDNYIVCLARIDIEQKRQDILLKAMKIVHEYDPLLKLRFYGLNKNNNVKILEKMISELGLTEVASYCGITDQVPYVLSRAKMLVLSSDYEGIPNAIIDAMKIGLPVVSTDCSPGGAKELLYDDNIGRVVPCGDEIALAHAIIGYINNPEKSEMIGKAAQKSLDRFNEDVIYENWMNYIWECLSE